MPHVNIQYSANLKAEAGMDALCMTLAEVIGAQRDGAGARVFPIGGTRVFAYPAEHFAVADGRPKVIAVESSVTFAFVVIAAAAVTGSPWLLVVGLQPNRLHGVVSCSSAVLAG